jgi:hypothetical protein
MSFTAVTYSNSVLSLRHQCMNRENAACSLIDGHVETVTVSNFCTSNGTMYQCSTNAELAAPQPGLH